MLLAICNISKILFEGEFFQNKLKSRCINFFLKRISLDTIQTKNCFIKQNKNILKIYYASLKVLSTFFRISM